MSMSAEKAGSRRSKRKVEEVSEDDEVSAPKKKKYRKDKRMSLRIRKIC